MREVDLLLGGFADAHVADLSDIELAEFEALMDVPDGDVLDWLTERTLPAARHATALLARIRSFHLAHSAAQRCD